MDGRARMFSVRHGPLGLPILPSRRREQVAKVLRRDHLENIVKRRQSEYIVRVRRTSENLNSAPRGDEAPPGLPPRTLESLLVPLATNMPRC